MSDGIDIVIRWALGDITADDIAGMQSACQSIVSGTDPAAALGLNGVTGQSLEQRIRRSLRDKEIQLVLAALPADMSAYEAAQTVAAQCEDLVDRLQTLDASLDDLGEHDLHLLAVIEFNGKVPSASTLQRVISSLPDR